MIGLLKAEALCNKVPKSQPSHTFFVDFYYILHHSTREKIFQENQMIKSFRHMSVWQHSFQLSVDVFNLSKGLPRSEDYALTSQIRRSSNSVSANIAEAFGRKTSKDKIYYYTVSRGSAYETQNHLLYGGGAEYFDASTIDVLVKRYDNLIYELNKITNKLERRV